jgi:hypothetical protein
MLNMFGFNALVYDSAGSLIGVEPPTSRCWQQDCNETADKAAR